MDSRHHDLVDADDVEPADDGLESASPSFFGGPSGGLGGQALSFQDEACSWEDLMEFVDTLRD